MRGCDYAWGVRPGQELALARALKAKGFGFVVRYLSADPSKNLTKAEVAAYRQVGLDIVTVYEDAADAMLGGAPVGRDQAQRAKAQLDALDAPEHAPVYFAVDFQATAEQMVQVDAALDATAFVLSETLNGAYGGLATVTKAQHVRYLWQTLAWSAGQWDAKDVLEQTGVGDGSTLGVQWDLDVSKVADFGQWRWPAPAAKPARRKPSKVKTAAKKVVVVGPKKAAVATKKVVKAEPVMTAASVQATLAAVIAWWAKDAGLHWTTAQQHAALVILTALAGMTAALFTRPARVTVFFTALGTAAAAATAFGLHVTPQWLAAEAPAAALFVGGLLRVHVSPAAAASAAESAVQTVTTGTTNSP